MILPYRAKGYTYQGSQIFTKKRYNYLVACLCIIIKCTYDRLRPQKLGLTSIGQG